MSNYIPLAIARLLVICYNKYMKKQAKQQRAQHADAALGSVRAEGLKPTVKTQTKVKWYINGRINAKDLRRNVVGEMKALNS
jgi:hypothetical protein